MWPIHGTGIAHANPLEDTATRGISRADFQTALKRTDTGWKSTRLHAHIPNLTVLYSPGRLAGLEVAQRFSHIYLFLPAALQQRPPPKSSLISVRRRGRQRAREYKIIAKAG